MAPAVHPSRRPHPRGFSLVELIVVLTVALLLTGLMLPTLGQVRENAFRLVCASNQRQLGMGIFMYATDHGDDLPPSSFLGGYEPDPRELMIAYRGEKIPTFGDGEQDVQWDGLGHLYAEGYCGDATCFYCPSHAGDHAPDRYEPMWLDGEDAGGRIYTNFHYAGDVEWDGARRRTLDSGKSLVLATDGLRTRDDFNHRVGMNLLAGDGSVTWRDDTIGVYDKLPEKDVAMLNDPIELEDYLQLWQWIEELSN